MRRQCVVAGTVAFAVLTISLLASPASYAQSCQRYQERADHYTDLRRHGGSSRQMSRWQSARNKYKELYHECRRRGGSSGAIKAISRQPAQKNYTDHKNTHRITSNNSVVRKLYQTCNYWIRQHNSRPTRDTLTFRNAACKAAKEGEKEARAASPRDVHHVRSIKECVKPNNMMDNEVSACLEGRLEPYWNAR